MSWKSFAINHLEYGKLSQLAFDLGSQRLAVERVADAAATRELSRQRCGVDLLPAHVVGVLPWEGLSEEVAVVGVGGEACIQGVKLSVDVRTLPAVDADLGSKLIAAL